MQFKKNDIRKQILEQMEVPEETVTFLEGQDVPLLFEWCFLCAVEGMTKETLEKICAKAQQDRSSASGLFKKERGEYLRETYNNNTALEEKFELLQKEVKEMYQRATSVTEAFEQTVNEAFREKDKLYGRIIEGKDEILRVKDKQITDLEQEIARIRKESESKDEKIHLLEDRLQTARIKPGSLSRSSDDPRDTKSERPESGLSLEGKHTFPVEPLVPGTYPPSRPKRRLFAGKREREAERFIRQFMEDGDYSEEQKEFLIRCLEQGDPLDLIREYASPRLSVEHMAWLRRIIGRRVRYGR